MNWNKGGPATGGLGGENSVIAGYGCSIGDGCVVEAVFNKKPRRGSTKGWERQNGNRQTIGKRKRKEKRKRARC